MDEPFFHRPAVGSAIDQLSGAEEIAIFFGAGVAKDRGSPDWNELARKLLVRALTHHPSAAIRESRSEIGRLATLENPPAAIASAVRSLRRDDSHNPEEDLDSWIRSALYDDFSPGGSLANLIATVAAQLSANGRKVTLITTNYDNYVEEAWNTIRRSVAQEDEAHELARFSLVPVFGRPDDLDEDQIPVVHLHGVVMSAKGQPSQPIFCEEDYSKIQGQWQEDFLAQTFASGAVLFVGSSLGEPYLPSCLVEARSIIESAEQTLFPTDATAKQRPPWFALMPRQGQPWMNEWTKGKRDVRLDDVCKVVGARFSHLGVKALFPDFYSQVSQFLMEIGICSGRGEQIYTTNDELRYGRRLTTWARRWEDSHATSDDLEAAQTKARTILSEGKREILGNLDVPETAGFKIELWVRGQPDERHLTLWAGSEVLLLSTDAAHNAPIEHASPYLAVQTFAAGRPLGPSAPTGVSLGRWTNCIATPVWLQSEPWFRLPVGTIALLEIASDRSVLANTGRRQLSEIAGALQNYALRVLSF